MHTSTYTAIGVLVGMVLHRHLEVSLAHCRKLVAASRLRVNSEHGYTNLCVGSRPSVVYASSVDMLAGFFSHSFFHASRTSFKN